MIKSRINFVILLLIVVMVMAGAALAFQNEPEGFRGLLWGDPPTEEMEFLKTQPLWNYYTIPNEHLFLGEVTLFVIGYQFFIRSEEEILAGVALYFKGEENYDRMERICEEKFGEEMEEGYQDTTWASLKSMVVLHYDTIEESGFLGMGSMPIYMEHAAALKKLEAEKAKGDW